MNIDHFITQDDDTPAFVCTPRDGNGDVLRSVPNGTTVDFIMKKGNAVKVDKPATLFTESDTEGTFYRVRYEFDIAAGETDTTGRYDTKVRLNWPGGGSETFPNKGNAYVHVTPRLD